MEHIVLHLILSAITEVLYQIAITRILTMRSRTAYYIIKTANFCAVMLIKNLGMLTVPIRIGSVILFDLALPVVLSCGSLPKRMLRTLAIELDAVIAELVGVPIYVILFGRSTESMQMMGHESVLSMVVMYLIVTFVLAFLFKLTVDAFNHGSESNETFFSMPTILLMLGAFLVFAIDYARFLDDSKIQVPSIACSWLALCSVYLILHIARRDATSQHEAADAALAARKARHTVTEVQAMSWRAKGLAALRHELATNVREIPRLAGSGRKDEAASKLSDLLEQARILNGHERWPWSTH